MSTNSVVLKLDPTTNLVISEDVRSITPTPLSVVMTKYSQLGYSAPQVIGNLVILTKNFGQAWEYCEVTVSNGSVFHITSQIKDTDKIKREGNASTHLVPLLGILGREGWELCAVVAFTAYSYKYSFKRKI